MITPKSRRVWALALGLSAAGLVAGHAHAASIDSADAATTSDAVTTTAAVTYNYQAVGSVGAPTTGPANLVYYNGMNNGTVTPPDNINLGQFVVSPLASTVDATYTHVPFQIIISSGVDQSEKISGEINGAVGPNAGNAGLTATITAVDQYGNNPLPFNLTPVIGAPLTLSVGDGTSVAPTTVMAPASPAPVPEPASIAVFAVALGGLGLWHRRRAGR